MIKLELNIEDCNTILRVMAKHPFEEVFNIITKIKEQGEPQVAASEAAQAASSATNAAAAVMAAEAATPPAA